MGRPLEKRQDSLYERDFYAWTQEQAEKLRARAHNDIDWENAAEEIDSVGRSQKHEIRNRMKVLIQHLLKWQFQPAGRSNSWQSSISEQRTHISGIISDSPSLASFPLEAAAWAFPHARRAMLIETRLASADVPTSCPYTVAEMLDEAFMPGIPWKPEDLTRD
jgi:hypothetical protein